MTADDLPAAFSTLPPAWAAVLPGWTRALQDEVVRNVRRVSADRPIAPPDPGPFRAFAHDVSIAASFMPAIHRGHPSGHRLRDVENFPRKFFAG